MNAWDHARLRQRRFARVADLVERFADQSDWPSVACMNERFGPELASVGMRLVEAGKTKPLLLADGTIDPASLYEVRIVEHGEIPTRPRNAHDLLNAVIWAAFPRSKLALSQRLASLQRDRARGQTRLPSTRTREHDRLALIDEGALLVVRGQHSTTTWIFGHAIYEHAYAGELAVRGTAIDLEVSTVDDLAIDAARAAIDSSLAAVDFAQMTRPGPGVPVVDD